MFLGQSHETSRSSNTYSSNTQLSPEFLGIRPRLTSYALLDKYSHPHHELILYKSVEDNSFMKQALPWTQTIDMLVEMYLFPFNSFLRHASVVLGPNRGETGKAVSFIFRQEPHSGA